MTNYQRRDILLTRHRQIVARAKWWIWRPCRRSEVSDDVGLKKRLFNCSKTLQELYSITAYGKFLHGQGQVGLARRSWEAEEGEANMPSFFFLPDLFLMQLNIGALLNTIGRRNRGVAMKYKPSYAYMEPASWPCERCGTLTNLLDELTLLCYSTPYVVQRETNNGFRTKEWMD